MHLETLLATAARTFTEFGPGIDVYEHGERTLGLESALGSPITCGRIRLNTLLALDDGAVAVETCHVDIEALKQGHDRLENSLALRTSYACTVEPISKVGTARYDLLYSNLH